MMKRLFKIREGVRAAVHCHQPAGDFELFVVSYSGLEWSFQNLGQALKKFEVFETLPDGGRQCSGAPG